MSLDFVAQRYGMLPSQLLREGNSLDFIVADTAQGYQNHLREQANQPPGSPQQTNHNLSEEKMMDMIKKVKEQAK